MIEKTRASLSPGSGCNTALLFLTDGDITSGKKGDEYMALLRERHNAINTDTNPVRIFTFTMGDGVSKEIPSQVLNSCDKHSHGLIKFLFITM